MEVQLTDKKLKDMFDAVAVFDVGEYVAGFEHPTAAPFTKCAVTDESFIFVFGKHEIGRIRRDSVAALHVEDETTIEKRITATRILALGLFSLAFRKKKKEKSFALLIDYTDGIAGQVLFKFDGIGPQLRANAAAAEIRKYTKK